MTAKATRSPGGRRLDMSIDIEAPAEAVWQALTDPGELTRWFPLQAKVNPGAGGTIWVSWGPPHEGAWRIDIWEPARRLRLIDMGSGNSDLVGGALDHLLEGAGGKTTLRLTHSGFGRGNEWDEEFDEVRRGWRFELRSLRHYLERHRRTPRLAIWPRAALPAGYPVMRAWERLMSRDGLLREGALAGLRERDRFAIRTAAGDSLQGTVLINEPPDFTGIVENLNEALLRVHVSSGRGLREAGLWLATWGVPRTQVEAIERGWGEMLRPLLA